MSGWKPLILAWLLAFGGCVEAPSAMPAREDARVTWTARATTLPSASPSCFLMPEISGTCCDSDGDRTTVECPDFQAYFLRDPWCAENPTQPCPTAEGCVRFPTDTTYSRFVEACPVSTPDCNDGNPMQVPPNAWTSYPEICDGLDNQCNGLDTQEADTDRDGWTLCRGDCDDSNSQIYPGAEERCDTLDNNCNDQADEPFDQDRDGTTVCGPDGVTGNEDDDCDDTDPIISPSQPEVCDLKDNDCSGRPDDGQIPGASIWWIDQDGDGFAFSGSILIQCDPPSGYVEAPADLELEDCNDRDASVFPGAPEERLDGFDTNCDHRIPLFELDCDDDAQFPLSRVMLAFWQSGEGAESALSLTCGDKSSLSELILGAPGLDGHPNDSLVDAQSLGLKPCRVNEVPPPTSCLGLTSPEDFILVCDDPVVGGSGFWMVDNYTELKPEFDGGRDNDPSARCDKDYSDCDDQSRMVCGCTSERCDGVDSNCAREGVNVISLDTLDITGGGDGLPDAQQVRFPRSGTVSGSELDADVDGVLACTAQASLDALSDDLYAWSSVGLPATWSYADCADRCALQRPGAEELCDGIPDSACKSLETGEDQDPGGENVQGIARCGYYSDHQSLQEDALYVLTYRLCEGCEGLNFIPLTTLRSTLPAVATWQTLESECSARPACVQADPTAVALNVALEPVAAFLPTPGSKVCLPTRLGQVETSDQPALELVRLCLPSREAAALDPAAAATAAARCKVTRLKLNAKVNNSIFNDYNTLISSDTALCNDSYSARALWPVDRISSAREVIQLWHCIQSGQCLCRASDGSLEPVYTDCTEVVTTPSDRWQRLTYKKSETLSGAFSPEQLPVDLGPFLDPSFTGLPGWIHGCWTGASSFGGGCEDGSRDSVEGPRDIFGRLKDLSPECGTCTDFLDNNCNGLVDEDDPGCYPCFVGQGASCSCRPEDTLEDVGVPVTGAPLLLGLLGLLRRRATRTAGGPS